MDIKNLQNMHPLTQMGLQNQNYCMTEMLQNHRMRNMLELLL